MWSFPSVEHSVVKPFVEEKLEFLMYLGQLYWNWCYAVPTFLTSFIVDSESQRTQPGFSGEEHSDVSAVGESWRGEKSGLRLT